jgi:hypothetical protein
LAVLALLHQAHVARVLIARDALDSGFRIPVLGDDLARRSTPMFAPVGH